MKSLRYAVEAAGLYLLMGLFRALPLDAASALGSGIARALGPHLSVARTAEKNLRFAFPAFSETQIRETLCGMWDNLGRVAAEYAHLTGRSMENRIQVEGAEILEEVKASGKGAIFIAAHLANWELGPMMASRRGFPMTLIYRHANNPYVDRLIRRIRSRFHRGMQPKGGRGTLQTIRALRDGGALGIMVDQKLNEGMAVPFFGRDAMTPVTPAQLALKYEVPVIPVQTIRTGGAHFTIIVHPPLSLPSGDGTGDAAILEGTRTINALLEQWIAAHPEQWFWVHRRWPREEG